MSRHADPDPRLLRLALAPEATAAPRHDLVAAITADVARTPQRHGFRLPAIGWLAVPERTTMTRLAALGLTIFTLLAWMYLIGQRPTRPQLLTNGDVFVVRNDDLWRVPWDGGPPRLLAHTPDLIESSPIWSPDGLRAAMLTTTTEGRRSLDLIDANGLTRQVLVAGPDYLPSWDAPIWSPDGREILFVEDRTGYPTVAVVDVESRAVRKLTADWPLVGPRWSPDGRWIAAFTPGAAGSDARVALLDPAGGGAREIFSDTGQVHGLNWTPDATALIFSIDRTEGANIVRLSLDGSSELLTPHGADPIGAVLSPDGSRIAFGDRYQLRCTAHPHVMNVDGSDVRRLRDAAWLIGWSPDGEWVLAMTETPLDPMSGGLIALRADGSAEQTVVSWTEGDIYQMTNGGWCTRDIGYFGGIGWQGTKQ